MKIVLNTQSPAILDDFIQISKRDTVEIINAKIEKMLFDSITVGDVDAFVLDDTTNYYKKAIDFIKKKHPYIPVVIIIDINKNEKPNNADIYIPYISQHVVLYSMIYKNVLSYQNNFKALQRLTMRIKETIEFGDCVYDPNKRTLYHKGKEISKFSVKSGGIIEMLAANYGTLVKKEIILEKVWLKSDYFSSRSMDVYVTNIRKVFKENKINMKIKNISKAGLILE
jgi:hypothetical protein